ncbi:MAG TPA: hypothetical protein VGZ25_12420 [Gemmataceae bacterium]|jgi:hypothetical protein|nr:hypothetical protein [Gemmataceae bacterium]
MQQNLAPSVNIEELDRFYRAGGLRNMASPHIHYQDGVCPHPGCSQRMEWIDFQLELFGDPENVYKPLVVAWWDGRGFAGKCPTCSGWIHFTTLGMEAVQEDQAMLMPRLPENWHTVAQFG